MTAKLLSLKERSCLEVVEMWLDSMRDWFAIISSDDDQPIKPAGESPPWVHVAVRRLDKSIFAPVQAVLSDATITPYRLGYALGLMKWGGAQMNVKVPPEVKKAVRGIRLSRQARKQMYRMLEDFLINVQIITRKRGSYEFVGKREIKMANSLAQKYAGKDESDFHHGLSDGLRGVGRGAPRDRSTDATDVYLVLVVWWRFVARLRSITQLHNLLTKCLGPTRAGEQKRTEKICQRIGLKLAEPGRPAKIQTLSLPS